MEFLISYVAALSGKIHPHSPLLRSRNQTSTNYPVCIETRIIITPIPPIIPYLLLKYPFIFTLIPYLLFP